MKTPQSREEVSREWLEGILTIYEEHKGFSIPVQVKDFYTGSASRPGDSFNGDLMEVCVSAFTQSENHTREERTYALVVKFLNREPVSREMTKFSRLHEREFIMYTKVLKELHLFQMKTDNRYTIEVPEFIYGECTEKEFVVVMEDLKSKGYYLNPKNDGINYSQAKAALEQMAHLHSISYAYNKKYNLLEKFPVLQFDERVSFFVKHFMACAMVNIVKFLRQRKGYEQIAKILKRSIDYVPYVYYTRWNNQKCHKIYCLTHGDFWNNNLMFKIKTASPSDETQYHVKVIDWQLSHWNNPVMDLHYFIYSSLHRTLRKQHLEDLLHYYYSVFMEVTSSLGCSLGGWSYSQFREDFKLNELIGFGFGCMVAQGTLSKAGERINQMNQTFNRSPILNKILSSMTRIMAPNLHRPCFQFLMASHAKRALNPIAEEMISGTNTALNNRILDLVEEAHESGLLSQIPCTPI